MTGPGDWDRLRDLFAELSALEGAERERRITSLAAAEPALATELRSLLETEHEASAWFGDLASDLGNQRTAEIDASWAQGRTIGPYALHGLLGTGGMGSVFRARRADGHLERDVALKIVPAGLDSPRAIERFVQERDILASLSHPNIAQLLDAGISDEGKPWFALELVAGKPITQWCDARRLPLDRRIALFLQLADAVQFAHRNLIVHRDLKPGNVLVDDDGRVKLLDFGIARMLEDGAAATDTVSRLMTPAYAAPEQLMGQRLSTATDVWSLGVILHELLTGMRPPHAGVHGSTEQFDTTPPSRLISARNSGRRGQAEVDGGALAAARAAKPEGLRRSLRGDLDLILLKALSSDPGRRYESAGQMADDLRRYLNGQPISARPDSLGYRLGKLVRRHPWATAALVLVMTATLVFAIYAREQARVLAQERDRARRVADFLTEVFTVSDPERAQGNSVSARELLARGVERAEQDLSDEPGLAADFLAILGRTHQNLGDYETAEALLARVLDLRRNRLNASPAELARSLMDLGEARRLLGLYESAALLLGEARELVRPGGAGADPALHAETLSRLGRVVGVQGDNPRSQALLEQSILITRQLPGLEDLTLANRLNDLASAHFRAGQFGEARELLEESVQLHRRVDRWHRMAVGRPETATALNNLALAHYLQGNHTAAEPLFREALAMRTALLGEDHPEIAQTQTNLGLLLRDSGRLAAAETALREALRIRESALSPDHPLVAQAMNNLAMLRQSQGDHAESETLFRASIERLKRQFGSQHPQVASAQTNLGRLLLEDARPAEALALFEQSLAIRQSSLPPEHPYLAWSLVGLARAQMDLDQAEAALPAADRALEIRLNALPGNDPLVGEARLARGQALMMLGQFDAAHAELEQSLAILHDQPAYADAVARIKIMLGELRALRESRLTDDLP